LTRLHRSLDGEPGSSQPFEHFIGILCEEFHCLPSQAWAELQRLPSGFLQQVLEYRRYVAAYFANEADPKGWQSSAMRTLAMEIEHALAAEEIQQRG
jgi:hypothetical protein